MKVKLKETACVTIKNYYGRKVRTILADQVKYIELKKIDKPEGMETVQHDIKEIKRKLDFESNNLVK